MAQFDNARALAKRLIDKNGRPVTLLKSGTTAITPSQPWRGQTAIATEGDGTSVTATGVFLNQADQDNFGFKMSDEDGTLLKRGQQRVLIADADLSAVEDIELYDILKDGTDMYRIVDANVLKPGTQRVLYDLVVEQ